MIFTANETEAYKETAGATKLRMQNLSGNQPGDTVKGVQLIIEAAMSENPPLRLPLGTLAINIIRSKMNQVESDIQTWEEKSRKTDY